MIRGLWSYFDDFIYMILHNIIIVILFVKYFEITNYASVLLKGNNDFLN